MYGNTEKAMDVVARGIASRGVPLQIFDAARTHVSYILPALWTQAGVMIGAPTYEGALFPPVLDVLNHAAIKRIVNKKAAMFGSFGWSGGAVRNARQVIEPLKWELGATFEFAGYPTHEELAKAEQFGQAFADTVKGA
jgi:anaerobic nitric oxide reductase flavorubredoxin